MSRLGIITGMAIEAARITAVAKALPEVSRPLVASVGGNSHEAERTARSFVVAGVTRLVSFGIAGGLEPSLSPGDIVLADGVWLPDGKMAPTDSAWVELTVERMGINRTAVRGIVAGSDKALVSVEEKAALRSHSGAVAVDMESHGVARAAAATGKPLLVVRAIADPSTRSLPNAALVGIGSDGRRRPFSVLAELVKNPLQFGALMRVAGDSNRALESLSTITSAFIEGAVSLD